ncbi:MAG: hypothetical protein CMF45_08820 [Legionellales bacterium]|nr:hypothetical protein [Legionellales bacterium]
MGGGSINRVGGEATAKQSATAQIFSDKRGRTDNSGTDVNGIRLTKITRRKSMGYGRGGKDV